MSPTIFLLGVIPVPHGSRGQMTGRIGPRLAAAVVAVGVAIGTPAVAASVTTYADEASFTSALEAFWDNEFPEITADGSRPNPSSFSGTTSGTTAYAYSATATGGLYGWAPGTPGPALSTSAGNAALVFNSFSPGVAGFGGRFWVADFNDGFLITGRPVTLTLALSDNSTASATTTVSSTATFLGLVVDDPTVTITSATLTPPGSTGWVNAAGQVIVGTAVPEPQTIAIGFVAAAGAFVGWRRRSGRGSARGLG